MSVLNLGLFKCGKFVVLARAPQRRNSHNGLPYDRPVEGINKMKARAFS